MAHALISWAGFTAQTPDRLDRCALGDPLHGVSSAPAIGGLVAFKRIVDFRLGVGLAESELGRIAGRIDDQAAGIRT